MEFVQKINELANRVKTLRDSVTTEEATKHSFVMPFISILGYDVFNPTIVVPEFTADIGKKKGEKVDYAIIQDGKPLILIEVKHHLENLDKHSPQLERYYTVTESKFGILTNGIEYRFFSDIDKPNKMDTKPFLVINLLDLKDREIKELERFTKENLDVDKILNMANKQKYVTQIKQLFKKETIEPSDELAKFFANKITDKTKTKAVIDEFKGYIKTAFSDMINDMAQDKINALKSQLSVEINDTNIVNNPEINEDGIITTDDEIEGYFIVKSILAEIVPLSRVIGRDTKSYFGILLDDNNRKWIVRLLFNNTTTKYIEIRTGDKESEKYLISKLEDIYTHKDKIKAIVESLEAK
ncbi:MAG: type I restriction endonuclease [Arcobacteraceae bacterium]|jgi:hypothetical protein|nr:type I restriction endonuclease [Arcobacteraceae bacterium]